MPHARSTLVTLGSALVLALALPAAADSDDDERRKINRIDREVLMELGRQADDGFDWLFDGKLRIKGTGLQWKRKMELNDRPLVMKLGGPVVKGGYGLKIEIEF